MQRRTLTWVLFCAILLTFAQINLFGIYRVSSVSMEPTLAVGSVIVAKKFGSPKIGDIVVMSTQGLAAGSSAQWLIKRVVGLPGDLLTLDGSRFVVPNGCVFVLGDNQKFSMDSRDFGAVPVKNIIGMKIVSYARNSQLD